MRNNFVIILKVKYIFIVSSEKYIEKEAHFGKKKKIRVRKNFIIFFKT